MGSFSVDATTEPGILHVRIEGALKPEEARAFRDAHDRAIDGFAGRDYRVFVDLSGMLPLEPAAAGYVEEAKRHSAAQRNFRGSAVFVASPTVAMQHRRTSGATGVLDTELISSDLAECRAHLARVSRSA
jgi:hypothetical protein